MFDYYGDFNSLYTKFSTNNFYQIGILAADRNVNRIGYNVIQSKLKKANRITIPLGSKIDDAPLFFIFMGLGLSILMGILVNSKKKFREDAIRALLRPYNFFADIRDHRIMSGVHTAILMVILAGAHALLLNNLFYFLRTNLLFDKLLIAFGNPQIIDFVSYFAWNPIEAFFLLIAISLLSFLVISVLIKWASFFIRTKIYYRNIFFTIVWAYLPVVILLPLTMVLYRILEINMFNTYLYIFLLLYFIWTVQRLLKGVYVIFDVGPVRVYFYAILLFVILIGGTLFYYQFTYASIDYIINTFKQFQHL
jgi:beta-galactosidase